VVFLVAIVFFYFLFFLGLLGNVFVLWAVLGDKAMRWSAMNLLLVNLVKNHKLAFIILNYFIILLLQALADLWILAYFLMKKNTSLFNNISCSDARNVLFNIAVVVSNLTYLVISVERLAII
jgi:hypothetical protein